MNIMTGPKDILTDCVDPSLSEINDAHLKLSEHMARLSTKLIDLQACREQKQLVSLSLAAEDVSKIAEQIRGLAASMHAGLAKALNLGSRL